MNSGRTSAAGPWPFLGVSSLNLGGASVLRTPPIFGSCLGRAVKQSCTIPHNAVRARE